MATVRTEEFHRDPYPTYQVLRDEHPVFFDSARGAYVLSRFADVREAARDHLRFSSAATRSEVFDRITRMDPPEHDLWRGLLAARFRPRRIATLEPDVRALARGLLAAPRDGEPFDIVEQFATPIPSTMIGDLIGLPRQQHRRCHVLSEVSIAGARNWKRASSRCSLTALIVAKSVAVSTPLRTGDSVVVITVLR
ncbi:MAG: hypothetical protein ABIQ73_12985 [Acidimicrobiales bacterium]